MRLLLLLGRKSGYYTIKKLFGAGKNIVGVFTEDYERLNNEGYTSNDFKSLCEKHDIPFFKTDKINSESILKKARKLNPDIGVSSGWRRIVNDPFLSIPKNGFINIHMSDLPKYRGFASTSWAILNGEEKCGVTCHRMISGVADEGDIYLKKYILIDKNTSIKHLIEDSADLKAEMILEVVEALENNTLNRTPQNQSEIIMSYPRLPRDGNIDWHQSAEYLDRQIRSVTRPYPGAFTYYVHPNGAVKKLYIWQAAVVEEAPEFVGVPGHVVRNDKDSGESHVLTGDGILRLQKVQWDNDKGDFEPGMSWNSVQMRLGITLGDLAEILRAKK